MTDPTGRARRGQPAIDPARGVLPRWKGGSRFAAARSAWRRWPRDPRLYQIATLAGLLGYGVLCLHLEVQAVTAAVIVATALATQAVCSGLAGRPHVDLRSALISALSLCLLLRTGSPALAGLAAAVVIASKFLLRVRGKHVFNPTNLALVAMIAATGQVWVSPGQWGSGAIFAFLLASAGGLVVNRAARADVTLAFLGAWVALLIGRSLWLGEPLAIPFHRLQNGALVLFAFFMISDPRTTPDSRAGRLVFAALVALGAYAVQFRLFRTNGLLWSLAICSLAVPLIDRLLPGARYHWPGPGLPQGPERRRGSAKGTPEATREGCRGSAEARPDATLEWRRGFPEPTPDAATERRLS